MTAGRDYWLHEEVHNVSAVCPAEPLDSEHPLFILYTSGSTGKPKGILHTTAGYLLGCHLTTKYFFDLRPEDVYFCTADVGWITGHSYVAYGVLSNGGTSLIYEGAPNFPEPDRFWQMIDRHKVNIFYTAPTAIRSFIKWGDDWLAPHDLSSLRLLGTVGEPINPEAWMWYHDKVGGKRCPIVDTWWQTETGCHMIAPMPGAVPLKPGSATLPFFGVDAAVVDDNGKEVPPNVGGKLVIRRPWPSMLRTIYGDASRYRKTYWSEVKAATSPATARAATKTAISGSSAASTTCSTWPGTGSAPPRWRAPWSAIPTWPRPPSSAARTILRARPWSPSSRLRMASATAPR